MSLWPWDTVCPRLVDIIKQMWCKHFWQSLGFTKCSSLRFIQTTQLLRINTDCSVWRSLNCKTVLAPILLHQHRGAARASVSVRKCKRKVLNKCTSLSVVCDFFHLTLRGVRCKWLVDTWVPWASVLWGDYTTVTTE